MSKATKFIAKLLETGGVVTPEGEQILKLTVGQTPMQILRNLADKMDKYLTPAGQEKIDEFLKWIAARTAKMNKLTTWGALLGSFVVNILQLIGVF